MVKACLHRFSEFLFEYDKKFTSPNFKVSGWILDPVTSLERHTFLQRKSPKKTLMNNDTDSAAGVSQIFENNFSQNYQLDQFASHKTILFET